MAAVASEERGQQLLQEQPEAPAAEPDSRTDPAETPAEPASAELAAAPAELLATQAMAPADAGLLATQAMAPADAGLLATQAITPVDSSVQPAAPMEADGQVEAAPMEAAGQVEAERPARQREVKRPKSAYWLFQEELRGQVVAEMGPGAVAPKVAAALAARWKEMDEGGKAKYAERARELKEQYDKDIADGAVPAASAKGKKAAKAEAKKAASASKRQAARRRALQNLKRRAAPKKPSGSYSFWLTEHRKSVREQLVAQGNADPSFEDIAKAAGKTWLALSDEQKAPYVERARVLAAKFKDISKACKEYKRENAKDSKSRAGKAKVAGAKKQKKQVAGKAAKQAATKTGGKAAKETAGKAAKETAGKAAKETAGKAKKSAGEKASKQNPEPASAKEVATPQKRKGGAAGPTPKKAKKAPVEAATAYMDMALVAEAEKAGFAGAFRKLAEREDMRPIPQRKLLDALVASGGLLHRAKDALLAGTA